MPYTCTMRNPLESCWSKRKRRLKISKKILKNMGNGCKREINITAKRCVKPFSSSHRNGYFTTSDTQCLGEGVKEQELSSIAGESVSRVSMECRGGRGFLSPFRFPGWICTLSWQREINRRKTHAYLIKSLHDTVLWETTERAGPEVLCWVWCWADRWGVR